MNERVDDAAELIDPDWCNNKNRPYKAPLSIHTKHDAVVTPIDIDAPRYEFTLIEAIDDELVDDATEWARVHGRRSRRVCRFADRDALARRVRRNWLMDQGDSAMAQARA